MFLGLRPRAEHMVVFILPIVLLLFRHAWFGQAVTVDRTSPTLARREALVSDVPIPQANQRETVNAQWDQRAEHLRPGCRFQPTAFQCSDDRRAPCKKDDDPKDRGCGRQQLLCDYHLFRGSNRDHGLLIPCCEKRKFLELLEFVDRTLCGRVEWALLYGSLLAGVREEDLIDWDDDIDIVIHSDDMNLAAQLLNESKGDYDIIGFHPPVTRIYFGKQESVHLDVWWANTFGDCTHVDREWFPKRWLEKPFRGECKIQGRTYPCPKDKLEVLDYLYGNETMDGGGWRSTSGSSAPRCEEMNKCPPTAQFQCRAPPGTHCEEDHATGMTCAIKNKNETLLPTPLPQTTFDEVPEESGCHILIPFACHNNVSRRTNAWFLDNPTQTQTDQKACLGRTAFYNAECGIDSVVAVFQAPPTIWDRLSAFPAVAWIGLVFTFGTTYWLSIWAATAWEVEPFPKEAQHAWNTRPPSSQVQVAKRSWLMG
mmetsp:Transcript_7438/g.16787  ORF Transcript_7438/g.16787 Transcript_7438/m.16787 type:complete len:482 (+) Transcript_7438:33-1478(+)